MLKKFATKGVLNVLKTSAFELGIVELKFAPVNLKS